MHPTSKKNDTTTYPHDDTSDPPHSLRILLVIALSLLAFTSLCYAGIVHNSFLAESFHQAWSTDQKQLAHTFFPRRGDYRPLGYTIWFLGNLAWGYQPVAYRLFILALHMANGSWLYVLAKRLTRRASLGLLAGLVFISLSTSAQVVNWLAAGNQQVACVFGYLMALSAYAMFPRTVKVTGREKTRWYGFCFLGLLIAFLTNEVGLTWPLAALTLGIYLRRQSPQARANATSGGGSWSRFAAVAKQYVSATLNAVKVELRLIWPLLTFWVLFLIWRTIAVQGIGAYGANVHLRAGWFLINNAWTYVDFFTRPLSETRLGAQFFQIARSNLLFGLLGLVAVVVALWPARRMLLLTLILVLPVLNIPALHRGYLAGAGFALVVTFIFARFAGNLQCELRRMTFRRATQSIGLIGLAAALLAAQVTAVYARNAAWRKSGAWAQQVLAETAALVPEPANGTCFYYFDLPTTFGGQYVFTWGLREAVQAHYNNRTLDAYQVYATPAPRRVRYHLEATLAQIEQNASAPRVFLVYRAGNHVGGLLMQVSHADFVALVQGESTSR